MKNRYVSIIWKNLIAVAAAGVLAILIFSSIWPKLFYHIARGELSSYIDNSLGESAVRISYMLSGHKETFDLAASRPFLNLIAEYYDTDPADAQARQKTIRNLSSYLAPTIQSQTWKQNGSVSADNYSFVLTTDGTVIGDADCQDMAADFRSSPDYSLIMDQYDGSAPEEGHRQMVRPYLPSVHLRSAGEDDTAPYICCAAWAGSGNHAFALVSLMPVRDFQAQLGALDSISVKDYAFFCGNTLLWANRKDSRLVSFPVTDAHRTLIQYDTVNTAAADGIIFTTLSSYPSEELYLAASVSEKEMIYPFRTFFRLLQICVFLLIVILTIVFTALFQRTLIRLRKMNTGMQAIRDGDFEAHLADSKKDEIGSIARTINEMNDTIRGNLEEQIRLEKEKSRLKYSLLVSAMDPHFIYNTLDTVTFLAAMGKTEDIITVNNALIGTLKDRIKMKSLRTYDTVRSEREVLRQYMVIEGYLYSEPVDYSFVCRPEDESLKIPKNFLQPLVENAIKHGLMPNKTADRRNVIRGRISVRVWKSEDSSRILMQVSDNGVGMSAQNKECYMSITDFSKLNPDHIGLANIRLRLQYLYPGCHTFRILDTEGGGTTVRITIPVSGPQP